MRSTATNAPRRQAHPVNPAPDPRVRLGGPWAGPTLAGWLERFAPGRDDQPMHPFGDDRDRKYTR